MAGEEDNLSGHSCLLRTKFLSASCRDCKQWSYSFKLYNGVGIIKDPIKIVVLCYFQLSCCDIFFFPLWLYDIAIVNTKEVPPMKKFAAMFLSLVLCLSLLTAGPKATCQAKEPVPDPTPVVTLEPIDPDGPKDPEPPLEPQDDPGKPFDPIDVD